MELTGKIITEFNERGGVSNRTGNEWKAKSFVLEVPGEYPRKLVFDVFGSDRLQAFNIQVGETLTVHFDIDAHEYNGRWFTSIRGWEAEPVDAAAAPAAAPLEPAATPGAVPPPPAMQPSDPNEDLPF